MLKMYNIVNKRLPSWQDPPSSSKIQVRRSRAAPLLHGAAAAGQTVAATSCCMRLRGFVRPYFLHSVAEPLSGTKPQVLRPPTCTSIGVNIHSVDDIRASSRLLWRTASALTSAGWLLRRRRLSFSTSTRRAAWTW